MKLLLDNNLSPRLAIGLSERFPELEHVARLELGTASDETIWEFARARGFSIVTKDSDFNDLLVVHGPPPKVIWLRIGNCTTAQAELVIRSSADKIESFCSDPTSGLLTLL